MKLKNTEYCCFTVVGRASAVFFNIVKLSTQKRAQSLPIMMLTHHPNYRNAAHKGGNVTGTF